MPAYLKIIVVEIGSAAGAVHVALSFLRDEGAEIQDMSTG